MSWFLADDNLSEHPKVLELLSRPDGFAALGFWTVCGTWSRRNKTSGDVPRTAADASARKCGQNADASALAGALVEVGLWVETPHGYRFHDWDEVYKEETKAAERKQKDADRKRRARSGQGTDKPPDASVDRPRTVHRTPGPSPSPSPSEDPPVVPQPESQDPGPVGLPVSARAQPFDDLFRAACFRREITPPSMSHGQRARLIQRVLDHAAAKTLDFEAAFAALFAQAFEDAAATGGKLVLELESCEPGKPKPPRFQNGNAQPIRQLSKAALEQLANPPRKFV